MPTHNFVTVECPVSHNSCVIVSYLKQRRGMELRYYNASVRGTMHTLLSYVFINQ
jgi:hypothetical protein